MVRKQRTATTAKPSKRNLAAESIFRVSIVAYAVSLYFVMMPFDTFTMAGAGTLLRYLIVLPATLMFINLKDLKIESMSLVAVVLVYLLACTVSLVYTVSYEQSMNIYKMLPLNLASIIIIGALYPYSKNDYNVIKTGAMLGGVFTIILTVLYAGFFIDGRLNLVIEGQSVDPNYLNGYVFPTLAFGLEKLSQKREIKYFILSLCVVIFTMFTGSRGALVAEIAMILSTSGIVASRNGIRLTRIIQVGMVVGLIMLLGYHFTIQLLPDEIAKRFTIEYIQEYGAVNRESIWKTLLSVYHNSPVFNKLFGYGVGTTRYVNPYRNYYAHNQWIEELISLGIVGLAIFVCMQSQFTKAAIRSSDTFCLLALIGFLVLQLTLTLWSFKPIWNVMICILIASRSNIASDRG